MEKYGTFPPSQKVLFLLYTHGNERKCTRAEYHGRLEQKMELFDDYLKIAYWYPTIPPAL